MTDYLKAFKQYPMKKLFFITIKDNTQKSRWCQIGKVNDWIRRYAQTWYIVKGTTGGIHFHLLAGCKDVPTFRFPKGIHFHVKNLQNCVEISDNYVDVVQGCMQRDYIKRQKFESQVIFEPEETINIISKITAMIKHYWLRKENSKKSRVRRSKTQYKIQCVLDYLQKNLDEPRSDDERFMYTDYIYHP